MEKQEQKDKTPGEEMACLEIAIGILGVLLLIFPAVTSFRHLSAAEGAAGLALLAGVVLPFMGGVLGLREARQARALSMMIAGGFILTICAVILLIAARDGLLSWDFPVGAIYLTLALFSDIATYRFRRQVMAP